MWCQKLLHVLNENKSNLKPKPGIKPNTKEEEEGLMWWCLQTLGLSCVCTWGKSLQGRFPTQLLSVSPCAVAMETAESRCSPHRSDWPLPPCEAKMSLRTAAWCVHWTPQSVGALTLLPHLLFLKHSILLGQQTSCARAYYSDWELPDL